MKYLILFPHPPPTTISYSYFDTPRTNVLFLTAIPLFVMYSIGGKFSGYNFVECDFAGWKLLPQLSRKYKK